MSGERFTFDTNILFYSIDQVDRSKNALAQRLVGDAPASRVPVLLQSLGELCNSVRKRRPDPVIPMKHMVTVTSGVYEVVPSAVDDLMTAMNFHVPYGLQFWDAVLWATARRAGCSIY